MLIWAPMFGMHPYETLMSSSKCIDGHSYSSFLARIGETMLNMFAKNIVADENTKIQATRK